jgi:hypothetical protein
MNSPEQLEMQLWDLIYGLLPDDEARQLCERITSDPEVARAYARAKLRADLVGEAARIDVPQVELVPTPVMFSQAETGTSKQDTRAGYRWLSGLVSLAALLLVATVGYRSIPRAEQAEIAQAEVAQTAELALQADNAAGPASGALRTVLTRPAFLHRDVQNPLLVQTMTAQGLPVDTELEYRVLDTSGETQIRRRFRTGSAGTSTIQLVGKNLPDTARVVILPTGASSDHALETNFEVLSSPEVTHLATDRPMYRPGEAVFFRSVTLSRFDLSADREWDVRFSIENPNGEVVPESTITSQTLDGVGAGKVTLSEDARRGRYSVVASSDDTQFRPQRRDFFVDRYQLPVWKKDLELARDSYAPGDEVRAKFTAQRADGTPAAGLRLNFQAFADGRPLQLGSANGVTDKDGGHAIEFALPDSVQAGDALLTVTASDGQQQESIGERILVNLGRLQVRFFPEGGDLVAHVPSRVYFHAEDPLGEPVHVVGRIVDGNDQPLARVETQHEGRGSFLFRPEAGNSYRLFIESPEAGSYRPELPTPNAAKELVLTTQRGVFSAAQPLGIELRAAQPIGPLVLAAYCRSAMVGLTRVEQRDFESTGDGSFTAKQSLPVAAEAAGVVRLTAFDYRQQPPIPLAERLVFCRPTEKLEVAIQPPEASYAVGSNVDLAITTRTEDGTPASAVFGISVVSERALNLVDDQTPTMPTYFYLTSQVDDPSELEDADFYVQESSEAAQAIDLLLGTQGWRRFVSPPPSSYAGRLGEEMFANRALGITAPRGPTVTNVDRVLPPQVIDASFLLSPVGSLRGAPSPIRETRPPISLTGASEIVVFATILIVLAILLVLAIRFVPRRRIWVSGLAVAVVSLAAVLLVQRPSKKVASDVGAVSFEVASGAMESEAEETPADDATFDKLATAPEEDFDLLADSALGDRKTAENEAADRMERQLLEIDADEAGAQDQRAAGTGAGGFVVGGGATPGPTEAPAADEEPNRPFGRMRNFKEAATEKAGVPAPASLAEGLSAAEAKGAAQLAIDAEPVSPAPTNLTRSMRTERMREARRSVIVARQYAEGFGNKQLLGGSVAVPAETILWQPYVKTGAAGKHQLQFKVPLASGVYRLRADAHANGRLGAAEARIVIGQQ